MPILSDSEGKQIAEVLTRRANEIAHYVGQQPQHIGSVEMALEREMARLRKLRDVCLPPEKEEAE